MRHLTLSLTALALAACSAGQSDLDAQLNSEYGALLREDERTLERDDGSRLPELCRELALDASVGDRERTGDGRDLARGDGVVRGDDGERRLVALLGSRVTGSRVIFARYTEADRERILAGRIADDGRVVGRVLDADRTVRGRFEGRLDGDNLRARLIVACRELASEGTRETDDEANREAEESTRTDTTTDGATRDDGSSSDATRDDATRDDATRG